MGVIKPLVKEINQYLNQLNTGQQNAVLTVVKTFAADKQDWWDEISKEQQQAIDKALLETKSEKLTSHEQVMKKYSKWLKK